MQRNSASVGLDLLLVVGNISRQQGNSRKGYVSSGRSVVVVVVVIIVSYEKV